MTWKEEITEALRHLVEEMKEIFEELFFIVGESIPAGRADALTFCRENIRRTGGNKRKFPSGFL
jgi:hypothetical protein